jgi:hypothetical protein
MYEENTRRSELGLQICRGIEQMANAKKIKWVFLFLFSKVGNHLETSPMVLNMWPYKKNKNSSHPSFELLTSCSFPPPHIRLVRWRTIVSSSLWVWEEDYKKPKFHWTLCKEEPVQQNRLRDRCSSVRTPVTTTIVVVRENSIISHKRSGEDHLGSGQVRSDQVIRFRGQMLHRERERERERESVCVCVFFWSPTICVWLDPNLVN